MAEGTNFNPEGSGYDYASAQDAGIRPGKDKHWQSLLPMKGNIGMLLKGITHPSIGKTFKEERLLDRAVIKELDGRYYSVPVKPNKWPWGLTNRDVEAIKDTTYGESASSKKNVQEMIAASLLSRFFSPKDSEFGKTIPKIAKKGYYAVRNKNVPYTQASGWDFPDSVSKDSYESMSRMVESMLKDENYKKWKESAQFFHTPEEMIKQRKAGFKYDILKPMGTVGKYETFRY